MKTRFYILCFLLLMVLGCTKNNNGAGPSISIKSYTSAVYNNGNDFSAVLSYSQKGGSLSGDSLVILRRRFNQSFNPNPENDTFGTRLPLTPSVDKAEFTASLAWLDIAVGINGENDTCDFRFVLIDQNMNHSDTAATGTVIIYQY
ncbi:MAG TPA: hypothetical protein VK711_15665 [Puia sp.]|nr:hypothetical protein [Puia sp.]